MTQDEIIDRMDKLSELRDQVKEDKKVHKLAKKEDLNAARQIILGVDSQKKVYLTIGSNTYNYAVEAVFRKTAKDVLEIIEALITVEEEAINAEIVAIGDDIKTLENPESE